ncbi:hypothetical protein CDL15_Pgr015027 [Punica granatum]|uniref:Glycosyl transferase family 1 domain-containing protein n=1 Tax=Punica granatum TaxID=22663 RepID=A0A218X053_PUNGR|nr:hypothetical protein CDL15_Pgr015027 [Punica granatum]
MQAVVSIGDLQVTVVRQSSSRQGNGAYGSTLPGWSPPHRSPTLLRILRRDGGRGGWRGLRKNFIANVTSSAVNIADNREIGVTVRRREYDGTSSSSILRKRNQRSSRRSHGKALSKRKVIPESQNFTLGMPEKEILDKNSTFGWFVGPFGSMEDKILSMDPKRRLGTCDRDGDFARLIRSRRFLLILHELSMTGAPLSMMELATELLNCGADVSAVVLNKKGGLMAELARRGIKVLNDRSKFSFIYAMDCDLVIAGSAACAKWIEQYTNYFPAGTNRIAWWIMENRRIYFERSKTALDRVKMLIFISELQAEQWLAWCEEENIELTSPPMVVPLSVNEELALAAGIPSSLNTPSITVKKMKKKRQQLRDSVRKEMGLTDNDMLVISLSSINSGKGQLLLLESALLVIENNTSQLRTLELGQEDDRLSIRRFHSRASFPDLISSQSDNIPNYVESSLENRRALLYRGASALLNGRRKALSDDTARHEPNLKILIGSVASKSNKATYIEGILSFLSKHPDFSRSVLWTLATTRVASLYSAADVYVMNSQGVGETFGRVTIEAMAYGLPVLGTDAGGTKEIIEHNKTGLLHPTGRSGTKVLAENLRLLLRNPQARAQMGMKGRKKVEMLYLKHDMYRKLAEVLYKCMGR